MQTSIEEEVKMPEASFDDPY